MQGLITGQCDPIKKEVRCREGPCLILLSYNRYPTADWMVRAKIVPTESSVWVVHFKYRLILRLFSLSIYLSLFVYLIGGSGNNLKTKKVPFTSFSFNGPMHWIYLSPRFDIYFRIPLLLVSNSDIYFENALSSPNIRSKWITLSSA